MKNWKHCVLYYKELISLIYKELLEIEKKMVKSFMNRLFIGKKNTNSPYMYNVKRGSISLPIRDKTVKLHWNFSPIKLAKTQKLNSTLSWQDGGEMGTLMHCWWECKMVQPLQRAIWHALSKLQMYLPFDPAIPLLGIYSTDTPHRYETVNIH